MNTYTTSVQSSPSVGMDAAGAFVVVWQSYGASGAGADVSSDSVQGQRYASSGAVVGAQFQVNTYTTGEQRSASVAMDQAGDFVVAWQSSGASGAGADVSWSSVQGQRYASSGAEVGAQFQVNTYTTSFQNSASVAMDQAGDFVVVWESNGQDGGYQGIFGLLGDTIFKDGFE